MCTWAHRMDGQCVLQMGPCVTGCSAGLLLITVVNLLMVRLCLHLGSVVTLPRFSATSSQAFFPLVSPPWVIPTFWLLACPPPAYPFHFLEVPSALCIPS